MGRAAWKGPYVAVSLLQKVITMAKRNPEWWSQGRFQGIRSPEVINTTSRASTILPDFLRCKFGIHNGMTFMPLEVTEAMIGHRFGEFAPSRKVRPDSCCSMSTHVAMHPCQTCQLISCACCMPPDCSLLSIR